MALNHTYNSSCSTKFQNNPIKIYKNNPFFKEETYKFFYTPSNNIIARNFFINNKKIEYQHKYNKSTKINHNYMMHTLSDMK